MAARRRRSHGRHAGLIWGLVGLLSCVSTPSGATSPDEEWLTATKTRIDQVWIGSFLRDCQSQLPVEHPINRAQPSATLDLTVAKDGTLVAVRVHQASGVEGFDASAKDVLSASGPFPAPPPTILAEDGQVHVRWPMHRTLEKARAARGTLRTLGWDAARAVPAFMAQGRWRLALQRALDEAGRGEGSGQLVLDVLDAALEAHWTADEGRLHILRAAALVGNTGPWPERLRTRLAPHTPVEERTLAIEWALETRDDKARVALEVLARAAEDPVALPAQRALMQWGDTEALWAQRLTTLTGEKAALRRARMAAALGPKAAVEDMIDLLNRRAPLAVREAAAEALGAASRFGGQRWAVGARGCLADGRASVHIALLRGLARTRPSATAYTLVEPLLSSHDLKVRAAAVAAAPVVGQGPGKSKILKMCRKTGRAPVRADCVDALLRSGPRARAVLRRWIDDADPVVRARTRARLVALDDPEVMPRLARIDTWPDAQWIDAFRARYRYLWAAQGPKVALEAMAKRIDAADGEARVREVAAAWVALVQVVGARR